MQSNILSPTNILYIENVCVYVCELHVCTIDECINNFFLSAGMLYSVLSPLCLFNWIIPQQIYDSLLR